MKDVDSFLDSMNGLQKESEQSEQLTSIIARCTGDDLKFLWKLIDKDLKINIGAKYVLSALHPKAFDAYRNSNNLQLIVERVQNNTLKDFLRQEKEQAQSTKDKEKSLKRQGSMDSGISIAQPVKPMLARQTKVGTKTE
jgi:DNA ligase-3